MKVFVVVTKVGDSGDSDNDGDGGDDDDGGDDGGGGGDGDDSGYRGDDGNDEESHEVDGSQRGGAITWDSEYYTTQDTDHRARAGISQKHRHLDRLVDFSSSDDYSSGHDNYSHVKIHLEGG